jgi:methylthioribose-1-phosphate isomerase
VYAIKGIYDGNCFKLEEPVPVKEEYKVVIAFIDPVKRSQEDIFSYFNTWDDTDIKNVSQIVTEREVFTLGRENI